MRYQWIDAKWGVTTKELKHALLQHSYDETAGHGFILDEAYQEDKLAGRYIQKEIKTLSITSPLGKTETYRQTHYQTYQFQIDRRATYSLLLINPPRSALPLSSALAKLAGFRLALSPLQIDPLKWLTNTTPKLKQVQLTKLEANALPLNVGITGALTLRGQGDLLHELERLPNSHLAKVTKAEFSFHTDQGIATATLTAQGIAKMHNALTDHHLFPVLSETIHTLP